MNDNSNLKPQTSTLRVLIATDVFPPKCGGSGWSSYYLARALRERGHQVIIARPRLGAQQHRLTDYDGLAVYEFAHPEPPLKLPILTNYQRNERLYAAFRRFLADLIREQRIDLVHGQNGLSIPPAVMAAEDTGIASVSTVRDWWALCYFGTLRHGDVACQGCTTRDMVRGLLHIAGAKGMLGLPLIPYMQANLRLKRRWLGRSRRIIAVSHDAVTRLRPYVDSGKVRVIPNMIDFAALAADLQPDPTQTSNLKPQTSQWVFVGKLEANKGAALLVPALAAAHSGWPTLVLGDGKLREGMVRAAAAAGVGLSVSAWLPNDEGLRVMAGAGGLLFPSGWPEPLSRVLLEASALGLPIVAMNTGGTPDIIRDGETGLLAADLPSFAAAIARLEADPSLRARLGPAAQQHARATFSTEAVIPQVEQVYREAISEGRR